jgi:hypothetical protein
MPATAAAAGAIAAPLIGGILGSSEASKSRKAAAAAAAAAYAELQKVGVPPDTSKAIILQQFQQQGILTPELQQDIELQASEVAKIQEDPTLRNAQMDVLNTLGNVSRTGLQASDRSAYNELRQKTQQDAEAKRQQILQQMQARGMGSSGANLAAQLQASQASADTASAGADRLAAQASQNALAALTQRANVASGVRGQDLSAADMKAKAIDDRNNFLYQNSVSRQAANVAAQNSAQQANLANQQAIANANTTQSNQELLRQNEAKRQLYLDQLALATAKANALNNQGTQQAAAAQSTANQYSAIGNALGAGLSAIAAKPATAEVSSNSIYNKYNTDNYGYGIGGSGTADLGRK